MSNLEIGSGQPPLPPPSGAGIECVIVTMTIPHPDGVHALKGQVPVPLRLLTAKLITPTAEADAQTVQMLAAKTFGELLLAAGKAATDMEAASTDDPDRAASRHVWVLGSSDSYPLTNVCRNCGVVFAPELLATACTPAVSGG